MKHLLSILVFLLLFGCSTTVEKPKSSQQYKYEKFTGKIEKKLLSVESDWIGGSASNPIFYTLNAERIYTLGEDVYSYPITYISVNENGKVVYPNSGVALVGDVSVEHYVSFFRAASSSIQKAEISFPLKLKADSNFLDIPFEVSSFEKPSDKILFKYKFGKWVKE
ncbi:MAG: hypothetical protein NE330_20610 [Lentisphaeraceae bacterium]|nr:hypothetical protein [Lentisphaeraceae bacterium]